MPSGWANGEQVGRPDDGKDREWMKAIAQERRRFGYRRLLVTPKREGLVVNHMA